MTNRSTPASSTVEFLSSNTQDFIEVEITGAGLDQTDGGFLSSNTQDFIEVDRGIRIDAPVGKFLSSNTQDFIEVWTLRLSTSGTAIIPEL